MMQQMNQGSSGLSSVWCMKSVIGTVFLILLLRWVILRSWAGSQRKRKLPPGPPSLPIIGHLHLLGTHPHRSLAKLSERYGPLMYLRLGNKGTVIASTPEMAREFLQKHDKIFSGRPASAAGHLLFYNRTDIGMQSNTANQRHLRKLFVRELTGTKKLEASQHIRSEELLHMLHSTAQESQTSAKHSVEVAPNLRVTISNILTRGLLSKRYFGSTTVSDGGVDHPNLNDLKNIVKELLQLTGCFNVGDFIPVLKWFDIQGYEGRMSALHLRIEELLTKIIAERREERKGSDARDDNQYCSRDLLDVLLDEVENGTSGVTEENIKGVLLNALSAGVDTVTDTIEWAMSELLRSPQIMKRAQSELDTVVGRGKMVRESDIPDLKFLQAIVKETLRHHPSAPLLVPHVSTEACIINGFEIPGNTRLIVNTWAIHHDPKVWGVTALEFDPDRFMEDNPMSSLDVHGHHFEYLPFGSGRRICAGLHMGLIETQITLATLLQAFDWSLPEGQELSMAELGVCLTLPRAVHLCAIAQPRLASSVLQS